MCAGQVVYAYDYHEYIHVGYIVLGLYMTFNNLGSE